MGCDLRNYGIEETKRDRKPERVESVSIVSDPHDLLYHEKMTV
jgi:hypothetical protein